MILKRFLPKYVHFNGLKLSGVWKSFLSFHDFGVQKCKNQIFEENKGFECSFIEMEYRWLQTRLAYLKNTKHLNFNDFSFKAYFPHFQNFSIIISCTY